jgi:arylsulfatase
MDKNELQYDMQPKVTREGRPVRTGFGVVPGPADTYIAYGKAWANTSNTPFRLYKHWVHEGGISTPLIVHWPDRIKARGKLRHQPGHLIDIMATCVDVAGAKYPSEYKGNRIIPMEGKSLVPAFDNKPIKREAIYWEHEGNRAIRKGKWKLVSRHPGKWELYDLEADRTELNDLSQEYSRTAEQLKAMYEAWAARCGVQPWPVKKKSEKK